MRAKEFIYNYNLEENWKNTLSNLAIAGAISAGGSASLLGKQAVDNYLNKSNTAQQPTIQQPITQKSTVKPVLKQQPVVKKQEPKKSLDQILEDPHEKLLAKYAKAAGIEGDELAAFLAQCAHETHDFNSLVEYGGTKYFRQYDIKYNKEKAKMLGNVKAGDGAKYKGRGYLQITGRYNYRIAGNALGLPLEEQPELLEDPDTAAKASIWYWKTRVQPNVGDFNNVISVTKPINPKLNGLKDRKDNFKEYKELIASI